jgi:flavin reductase (DIM6/NTAB) family NADH-FMN oxidoreductase RutF
MPLLDKFDNVEFIENVNGVPVLSGSLANLECRMVLSYEGGDHTIFIGEIEKAAIRQGKPLLYFQGSYGDIVPRAN